MKSNRLLRWVFYVIELLTLFIFQSTPDLLPDINGVRPLLLIAAAISIAMFEGNRSGIAIGILAGGLCDFGGSENFGFFAILLTVFCFCLGSMTKELFRSNLLLFSLASVIIVFFTLSLHWFLFYVLRGYDGAAYVYSVHYFPEAIYTLILAPLIFGINKIIAINLSEAN